MQTAADVFGIVTEVDNNGGIHESSSIVQRNFKGATIDTGVRMGSFMAYLRPAMATYPAETLEVATRATVLKVLVGEEFDEQSGQRKLRALGVRYLRDGVCHEGALGCGSLVLVLAMASPYHGRDLIQTQPNPIQSNPHSPPAMAREEVIMSTGAYNTPKLLMLSGIGDCRHLEQVGIGCILNSPGVGKNLVDHINPVSKKASEGVVDT